MPHVSLSSLPAIGGEATGGSEDCDGAVVPDAPEHCLLTVGRAIVVSLSILHLLVKTDRSTRTCLWSGDFAFQCRGPHFSP